MKTKNRKNLFVVAEESSGKIYSLKQLKNSELIHKNTYLFKSLKEAIIHGFIPNKNSFNYKNYAKYHQLISINKKFPPKNIFTMPYTKKTDNKVIINRIINTQGSWFIASYHNQICFFEPINKKLEKKLFDFSQTYKKPLVLGVIPLFVELYAQLNHKEFINKNPSTIPLLNNDSPFIYHQKDTINHYTTPTTQKGFSC